ncbi:MAG TPA: TetR/AcrR family transcriptional regulator [Aliidongia sp.]|uniref:TetR/AcrR family transcriptional regulator n=1 Tax=Aliidongia sp. TaxID=1914230 RepID=UPI002DDD6A65|nr:TetR/AcrR family transcriptional regulator [Aliidongia sp.]HEV2676559.1 TetR/AcrR family transcriptional regulator [Aliidongia sp.]
MAERGRPRSFDRQTALLRAMELFWAKGFEDSSMTDLTQAMGIGSPSLYAAFGSKEALFREAVELYQATVGLRIWQSLDDETTIAGAIERFLLATAEAYSTPGEPPGCLIVLGASLSGRGDAVVCETLRTRRADNVARLDQRFARAVADGELPSDFDHGAAAAFYAALQHGMSIMARDGADAATLQAIARTGIRSLYALRTADAA